MRNVLITASSCDGGSVSRDWNERVIEHRHAAKRSHLVNGRVVLLSCIRLSTSDFFWFILTASAIERKRSSAGAG